MHSLTSSESSQGYDNKIHKTVAFLPHFQSFLAPAAQMHPSLVKVLPQDLIDRLIDTVEELGGSESQYYMQACASVCGAFLPRSQYHLFSSVKLNAKRLQEFYEIIKRKPLIAERVRSLHLVFYDGKHDWTVNDPTFFSIMTSITKSTTSLYKLKLEGQRPSRQSLKNPKLFLDRVFKPFLARFITSLHIEALANVPIDIIDSCIKLTELTLISTSLKFTHSQLDPPQHKIRKLEYNYSPQMKRLTMGEPKLRLDLSELHSLYVYTDLLTEPNFEQSIIAQSSALEELHFKILDDPVLKESQLKISIDLKCCDDLRILDFDINLGYPMDGGSEDDLETICHLLSTLPKATRLDTLRLTVYVGYLWIVDGPHDILNANWARLQKELENISAGKPFLEFALRMIYMNANDEGDDMAKRCEAVLDKILTEKLNLLTKNPGISVVNLGYYVDTPHES